MNKVPVKIEDNKLPCDDKNHYKVCYDYRKRTSGGFADAIVLGSIMLTGFMWFMILIALGK